MKKAFTLAEVLITLAIIGVVASMTIPSVIVNTNQQQFKTGLAKAVSALNQAISLAAVDGESPYGTLETNVVSALFWQRLVAGVPVNDEDLARDTNIYSFLTSYMNILKKNIARVDNSGNYANLAFYTVDGMRYEIPFIDNSDGLPLHEDPNIKLNTNLAGKIQEIAAQVGTESSYTCGSLGLRNNPYGTDAPPCLIIVDVNGDKKPNPKRTEQRRERIGDGTREVHSPYEYPSPDDKLVKDIFTIMITESKAIPYGVVAQKAMYQANKK